MAETKARKIAGLIDNTGDVKVLHLDNVPNAVGVVGTQVYSSPSALPTTGLSSGDQAFVTSNQRLYITNGAGWYNVAAINSTPRFTTSPNATYDLSNDLSATVITMVAQDSDGQSVTYSATDSGMAGIATVSNDSGVFTITPLTDSAGGTVGTFTLTFTATDGIGIASVLSTFTLEFGPNWGSTPTITTVTASDGAASDYFGETLDISSDGAYSIIGAPGDGTNVGAAYVYTVNASAAFTQQAKLVATDASNNVYFGKGVSLSSDGTYALVGARVETNTSGTAVGAAYVFIRSGTSWSQQAAIESPTVGTSAHQNFGYAIDMNSDGTYLAAGSLYTSKAYIFTRSGSTWSQQDELDYSDAYDTYDRFGAAIALNGNNYCIVGAHQEDGGSGNPAADKGAAYVFTRSGTTWTQQAKLVASDGVAGDKFGYSVAFNTDATFAAVGANAAHIGSVANAGAVYIFKRDGTSWSQVGKLDRGASAASGQNIGTVVGISADGKYVLSTEAYNGQGYGYVWDV